MTGLVRRPEISYIIKNLAHLLFLLLVSSGLAFGQVTTGTPPLGSFTSGPDVIDLANLNAHLTVPMLQKPGRGGMDFYYDLAYDSSVWYPVTAGGVQSWQPVFNWGWTAQTAVQTGYISYSQVSSNCDAPQPPYPQYVTFSNFVYHDMWGLPHSFPGKMAYGPPACSLTNTTTLSSRATDNSGLTFSAAISTAPSITTHTITTNKGQVTTPPLNLVSGYSGGSAISTDRNGNEISVSGTSSSATFTDTLNTAAVTVAGTATQASPLTFTYAAPSAQAVYTMKFTVQTVQTKFGCSVADYGPTANNIVSEIDLPDGSKYSFTYETTPGDTHNPPYVTGRPKSVTLPTGGQITYAYTGGSTGHISCSDGSSSGFTRTTPDGMWTYAQVKGAGAASTTTVTDPQNNVTTIQFQGIYETQRQVNQGSNTLLLTTNTCYNGATSPCNSTAITTPITQRATISTLPSTQQSKHVELYSGYGVTTETDDYDYGTGAPGALIKKVLITYASLGNINAFQQQVTVCNGSGSASACNGTGTVVSQTSYNYDETTPTASSGTPQHVAVTGSRGNLTSVTYPTGTDSQSKNTYFDTGVLQTSTDSNGAVTTYNFPDATSTCGNAFPTSLTEPLSMSRSLAWNCNGGVMTQLTDENSKSTSTTYNDPYFWRAASSNYPDGGQTSWTYAAPWNSSATQKMNSTQNVATTTILDGLGRFIYTQLTSDPFGTTTNQLTYYDPLGRVSSVYNPTRCSTPTTNCGESTWGFTGYSYDALNRLTSIRSQDGSTATASFVNNTATVTDQAGKARKLQTDSLGRVTNVWEDPAGLNLQSVYTYDALGNLTGVVQGGSRNRSYTFDGLSRMTSENNPESGAVSYTYNSNGDLGTKIAPAPNQTGSTTVTTTYSWDLLHRLTKKSYSDGTPTANFYFDSAPSSWQSPEQNTVGRLVEATTNNTATEFTYDPMGRIAQKIVCAPSICTVGPNGQTGQGWSFYYTYNLAGGLIQYNDGQYTWPQSFNQTFDGAGRVSQLTSTASDAQHPATFFTADATKGYFPNGALWKAALSNGLTMTNVYDSRLQPCLIDVNNSATLLQNCSDGTPSGNVLDFWMGYNNGSSDNGNVMNWNATGAQSFVRTYTYDSVNRLKTMADTVTAQPCKGLSWSYDAWGNRAAQTLTSGSCGQFSANVNAQNQLIDPVNNLYKYDAAGNMIHDASHSYTYDAENRLTAVDAGATASYIYDALGRRTKKTVGSSSYEYVYDNDGQLGWELVNDSVNRGYIRSNGRLLAEYYQGTTYFIHPDHLGSTRLLTGYPTPSVVECDDYYAYGEANVNVGSCLTATGTTLKFTGDERDTETNLDHTLFRQNSSTLGRWMTPDPAGLAAVDPTTPQSWNRYGYARNAPTVFVDLFGLDPCDYNPDYCGFVAADPPPGLDTFFFASSGNLSDQGYGGGRGGVSSGNSSGWWSTFGKTFLNGVLHGDRQPGQSFGACMDQNIKDTTFGTVDPKALTNKALVTAESTMVALGSIPVQTYVTSSGAVGTLNGISAGAIGVTRALGLGLGGSRVVIGALTGAGDALAVAGAATFGLVVGSAINCR
jgi:RHS repeat-associated protein